MKKKLIIALLALFPMSMMAQKVVFDSLPDGVKATFNTYYKDVKNATWEKKGELYQASFLIDETPTKASYQESGNKYKIVYTMPNQYIPVKISNQITKNYAGYKVKTYEMEDGQEGKLYIITIKKKKEEKVLYYSLGGDFVKDGNGNTSQPVAPAPAQPTKSNSTRN